MNKCYTYVYLDIRKPGKCIYGEYVFDYEPFYIGKGSYDRAYQHLKVNKDNFYFNNKIKKIQRETGKNPIVIIYKNKLTENDAYNLEAKMIKIIGRNDLKCGPLCNLNDGGKGGGCNPSNETRNKNRIAHIKENLSPSSLENYSRANRGINNPMYGVTGDKHPMYGKTYDKNPNSKKYELTYENGDTEIVECLKSWCDEHGFNYSSVRCGYSRKQMFKGIKIKKL